MTLPQNAGCDMTEPNLLHRNPPLPDTPRGAASHPPGAQCPLCQQDEGMKFLEGPDRFHGRTETYALFRCPSCSLVWVQNPPPPDEIVHHYGTDYDRKIAAAGETSPGRW